VHFPNLSRLLNDPVFHNMHWPPMPTKFPSDILKFEENPSKDLGDHMTTFHLWFLSNSLKDNFVQLFPFQCTLIGGVVKWYIEIDGLKYSYFKKLGIVFLNNFQLPMRYDSRTELMANFVQIKVDHIFDHI
jgi:hypothetical protein